MKKYFVNLSAMLLVLILSMSVIGCGGKDTDKVEVSDSNSQSEAYDQEDDYNEADSNYSEEEDVSADSGSSSIINYDNAEEIALDESYPKDIVPIPEGAKVIGCSMVPGTRSGFIDLIMPADKYASAVSFYTEKLSSSPKITTNSVQEAASYKREISGIKATVLVSHLQAAGNDTLIQITVNE